MRKKTKPKTTKPKTTFEHTKTSSSSEPPIKMFVSSALSRRDVVTDAMIANAVRDYIEARTRSFLKAYSDDDVIKGRPAIWVRASPEDSMLMLNYALSVASRERASCYALLDDVLRYLSIDVETFAKISVEYKRRIANERGPFDVDPNFRHDA